MYRGYCYIGLTGRDRSLALISKYQMENKLDNFCLNELKFTLNHLKRTKLTIDSLKKSKSPYELIKLIKENGYDARIGNKASSINKVRTVVVEVPPINPRTDKANWEYPFHLIYINQTELFRLNDKGYIYKSQKNIQKKHAKRDFYILYLGNEGVRHSLGEKINLREQYKKGDATL